MTFPAPTSKRFQDTSREDNILPQARETGLVIPEGPSKNATTVTTKDEPVAKPWAHFVAGGYVDRSLVVAEAN
jgi:hypothetical protein